MAGSSFSWEDGDLKARVNTFDPRIKRAMGAVMKLHAPRVESWMKHNAPWTDQTTNARNGLFAYFSRAGDLFQIILGHSVDYGIYLEQGTENMHARPVIVPAMFLWGEKVRARFVKLIDRLG